MRPRPATDLDYLISGPWAGSASVVLAAQCPVAGGVEGWGVFPIFDDIWHTVRIWLLGRMGSLKSSCRVRLDTYQGALVIMSRIFDCAFCSIAWLDLLAQPQISMPYVQIGVIIIVYLVIHKSVKHFKNSQQIDYVTDHDNSYASRERNSQSYFYIFYRCSMYLPLVIQQTSMR
jgi:hypothetical protein